MRMTIGGVPIRCQSALAICASLEALISRQFTTAWENFQENLGPIFTFSLQSVLGYQRLIGFHLPPNTHRRPPRGAA
jgi:hypothetical protein